MSQNIILFSAKHLRASLAKCPFRGLSPLLPISNNPFVRTLFARWCQYYTCSPSQCSKKTIDHTSVALRIEIPESCSQRQQFHCLRFLFHVQLSRQQLTKRCKSHKSDRAFVLWHLYKMDDKKASIVLLFHLVLCKTVSKEEKTIIKYNVIHFYITVLFLKITATVESSFSMKTTVGLNKNFEQLSQTMG